MSPTKSEIRDGVYVVFFGVVVTMILYTTRGSGYRKNGVVCDSNEKPHKGSGSDRG